MVKVQVNLYNYVDLMCSFVLEKESFPEIGDEVDVDFDDPKVEFIPGKWEERPGGLCSFKIHYYNENTGDPESQFAMDEE